MIELWEPIKGYKYYEISNFGNVRSLNKKVSSGIKNNKTRIHKGKVLKQKNSGGGYKQVCLVQLSNNKKTKLVHRLVAQAFIPNPENKPCINHIDSNRKNNNVRNLEWVTYKENTKHSIEYGNFKPTTYGKIQKKDKQEIITLYNQSKLGYRKIAKIYGVHYTRIYQIIKADLERGNDNE